MRILLRAYNSVVKPQRLPHLDTLGSLISSLGDETLPLDLFVVKAHLILERELYALLALRLGVEERQLPSLSFYPLAALALSGDAYGQVRAAVLALNDLRNEYAHELDHGEISERVKKLAERANVFYDESLGTAAADRTVRMAAGFCLADVWCHFTEYALANSRFPSEEASRAAKAELDAFRLLHWQHRDFEQSLSATAAWLFEELENYLHPRAAIRKGESGPEG